VNDGMIELDMCSDMFAKYISIMKISLVSLNYIAR